MKEKNSFFEQRKTELLSEYEDEIVFFSQNNYNLSLKFRTCKEDLFVSDSTLWQRHFPLLGLIVDLFKKIWIGLFGTNKKEKISRNDQLWLVAEIYPLTMKRTEAMRSNRWISFCGCVADYEIRSNHKPKQRKKRDFWLRLWLNRKRRLISKLSMETFYKRHKNDLLIRTFFYNRYEMLFNKPIKKAYPIIPFIVVVLLLIMYIVVEICTSANLYDAFGMQN